MTTSNKTVVYHRAYSHGDICGACVLGMSAAIVVQSGRNTLTLTRGVTNDTTLARLAQHIGEARGTQQIELSTLLPTLSSKRTPVHTLHLDGCSLENYHLGYDSNSSELLIETATFKFSSFRRSETSG